MSTVESGKGSKKNFEILVTRKAIGFALKKMSKMNFCCQ